MRKTSKKLLSLLLALMMCLALLPTAALADGSIRSVSYVQQVPGGEITYGMSFNIYSSKPEKIWHVYKSSEGITQADLLAYISYEEDGMDCSGPVDFDDLLLCFSTDLVSVTIPKGATTIGHENYGGTFEGCSSLTNVSIPDTVTMIGFQAFKHCTALTQITLPQGLTEIGYEAFAYCKSLSSINFPTTLTSISDRAFDMCDSLTDIYYAGTEAQWNTIEIGSGSNPLKSATIHYNSTGSDQPTTPEQPSTLPTVENIPVTGTAVARTQNVLLDGKTVQFQCYAVKDAKGNESNYVKVRDLAQALNGTKAQFNVDWDGKISITSNTVYQSVGGEGSTPYSGDQSYTAVSSTPVSFNGSSVNLTSFQLKDSAGNGYTYYKLRDLGQLLNFNVTWNGSSIVVESDKPYTG